MEKFILINYAYGGIKGNVAVSNKLSTEEIKKICVLDAIDKGLASIDEVRFFSRKDFEYERFDNRNNENSISEE